MKKSEFPKSFIFVDKTNLHLYKLEKYVMDEEFGYTRFIFDEGWKFDDDVSLLTVKKCFEEEFCYVPIKDTHKLKILQDNQTVGHQHSESEELDELSLPYYYCSLCGLELIDKELECLGQGSNFANGYYRPCPNCRSLNHSYD